jgi:tripartite ATP-independent transporter DctP family solute receptor
MKRWLICSLMLLLVVSSVACSSGSSDVSAPKPEDNSSTNKELPKVTLKFGHNAPKESPTGKAAEKLAEIVKEKSNGNLIIEVYPENQLGDNRDLVEQTSIGGLDMSMAGLGILGYLAEEYNLMQVPFLFRDQNHIHKVVEGDIGKEIADRILKEKDIRLLSQTWDRLPRQVSANKAIKTPADFENLLVRTGSKGSTEAFKLFGGKPTSIPLKEVYLALQNNVVEGVDLPSDYIVNLSLNEVNTHLNMVNHTYGTQFVAINGKRFAELPQEYQTILKEAVHEAGEFNNQLTAEEEGTYIQKLEQQGMKIVELTPEEHDTFTQIIQKNLAVFEDVWPKSKGLGEKILIVK